MCEWYNARGTHFDREGVASHLLLIVLQSLQIITDEKHLCKVMLMSSYFSYKFLNFISTFGLTFRVNKYAHFFLSSI